MNTTATTQADLEARLDDFDPATRRAALEELHALAQQGSIELPPVRDWMNLHCHSFYSYNGYGQSPSHLVWKARTLGLEIVGLVDFDVLDGVDEFHAAGRLLGIKTVAGMETRAYVASFQDREINSPGEPGITYHMGSGFVSSELAPGTEAFAADLRERAKQRNLAVITPVNALLDRVQLDYDADVLPLTPRGVATERHLCAAYQLKAEAAITGQDERAAFWSEKLGTDCSQLVADPVKLQATIRSKTMKRGGVGYQQPDKDSFPPLQDVNAFAAAQGAIPTLTWLDGLSAGEQAIDEMFDLQIADGVAAVNIVPDRNWNLPDPDVKQRKIAALVDFVRKADERQLPVQVGTELNAPGLKFVDDFDAPELAPVIDSFRRGARIIYGHCVELARSGNGYCSDWAAKELGDRAARNEYFHKLGCDTPTLPERA